MTKAAPPTIKVDDQDRNSNAWKKLCLYIDQVANDGSEVFYPAEFLGEDFNEIFTLPESVAKLNKVKKVKLLGSNLKRIPPEIGKMASLEFFDLYMSYDLHWLPYEISRCQNLTDSRISTRALYGMKDMGLPDLEKTIVRYHGDSVRCSICDRDLEYEETVQLWITREIGTDLVPLLINLCSEACLRKIPKYKGYPPTKGGQLNKKGP